MDYLTWNNNLGDFSFSIEKHDKIVSLFITEDDIFEIGIESNLFELEVTKEKVISDFKTAFRTGYPGSQMHSGNKEACDIFDQMSYEYKRCNAFYQKGIHQFRCAGVTVDYPAYLLHIVGIIVALTQRKYSSRYERVRNYFNLSQDRFPNMSEEHNWNIVWEHIVWWSNIFEAGLLGVLPGKTFSSLPYEYMNKPYVYLVLNRTESQKFYNYFNL